MTPERWKQVEAVFQGALDLAPEESARYVTSVRIGDGWVTWLAVDPQLDDLRRAPRFHELARRTGNPAATP